VGCIWSLAWLAIIRDTPQDDPKISTEEKEYITKSISGRETNEVAHQPTPWRKILTSKPYWGTVCIHITDTWTTFITVAWVPTYIARVLQFNVKTAGFISSLPYGLNVLLLVVGGFVADFVLVRNWFSRTKLRKLFSFIAQIIPILSLIMLPSFRCNEWMSVVLLCTSYMFFSLNYPGYRSSMVDMAPKYGGIIFGFSNTIACCISLGAPQLVGVILGDGAASNWRVVFYSTASVSAAGLAVYLIFGTSEEQTWSRSKITSLSSLEIKEKNSINEESQKCIENVT
uniref:Major facilitator superfamily (MFS) profile domain-containing protein n=2 Tax=Ciona savignyi TaxID=51511 RepID=H2ZMW3_CIOSA